MLVVMVISVLGVSPDRSDDPMVSAIRTAYEANLNALSVGTMSFTYSSGVAPDLASAISGQWSNRSQAEGSFAASGSDLRYERRFAPEVLNSNRTWLSEKQFSSPLTSNRVLTNGSYTLLDRVDASRDGKRLIHSARILAGNTDFFKHIELPLALGTNGTGYLHLGTDIARAMLHRSEWVLTDVDDRAKLDGIDVVKLTFIGLEFRRVYWVDLEHGAIPIRVDVYRNEKLALTFIRQDLHLFSGKGWYPCREITFVQTGSAREFIIDRGSPLGLAAPSSSFQLAFPAALPMINQSDMVKYPPRKIWDLRSLPSSTSPGVEQLKLATPPSPPFDNFAGERDAPQRWPILLMAFGAILLASLCFRPLMRLRRA
ncbi:hypothetical protein [Singulisphaera acidiphila]|uniref:Uncharacterized protein n=1 Tax=Singulisphaera acidiphila (strain ATCC BAA-1392 / DSM 18658 / VKM B-2454 / MOB10) TaxID=886293 RepID=L0DBJ5_SINAD|nr:hypothetical protein [Singulisphaera acidiphila]AGA26617.1 hypothetical protein Sinac_2299 [Singulisphaera acidiphila DSM 18658]